VPFLLSSLLSGGDGVCFNPPLIAMAYSATFIMDLLLKEQSHDVCTLTKLGFLLN
jgi:hypothetical protein